MSVEEGVNMKKVKIRKTGKVRLTSAAAAFYNGPCFPAVAR
jgi:hypothetical protein